MSSIDVRDLKDLLDAYEVPDDYEVIMFFRHNYDISKEEGENGWVSFINGVHVDHEHKEVRLMN